MTKRRRFNGNLTKTPNHGKNFAVARVKHHSDESDRSSLKQADLMEQRLDQFTQEWRVSALASRTSSPAP